MFAGEVLNELINMKIPIRREKLMTFEFLSPFDFQQTGQPNFKLILFTDYDLDNL